jgi:hypothetical protein
MTGNVWTPDMHARFWELHRDSAKLSFAAIAAAMSAEFGIELSRNACIGKARRLGLPMRGANAHRRVRKAQQKCRKIRKVRIRTRDEIMPLPEPPPPVKTGPFSKTIHDLRDRDCRWPGWAPSDPPTARFYCGEVKLTGLSYCRKHARVAFGGRVA